MSNSMVNQIYVVNRKLTMTFMKWIRDIYCCDLTKKCMVCIWIYSNTTLILSIHINTREMSDFQSNHTVVTIIL